MALLFRPTVAQKVLPRELVDVLVQAGLGQVSLVLAYGLRPQSRRSDPERVPPSRWFGPSSAPANVSEVRTDTAALRQDLKLLVGDLAANRHPGRNDRLCNPIRAQVFATKFAK